MLRSFCGRQPVVARSAYIDPSAQLIGDVEIGERASVWPNVSIRADIDAVRIGEETNIQDNSSLHQDKDRPLLIGARVVVGHSCTVHGCEIGDDCLIGMGATILSHAKIGNESLVAAGSLVLERQEFPPRSLIMGSPAKVKRPLTDEELERIRANAQAYVARAQIYLEESSNGTAN